MLPNTILIQSHRNLAEPIFEPAILWLNIWSGFEMHFSLYITVQVGAAMDGSDRPTAIVSKVGANAQIECKSSYKPKQPQPSSNIRTKLQLLRRTYYSQVVILKF